MNRSTRQSDRATVVGRDEVVGRIGRLIDEGYPIAIVGPAGIGKTTVALAAAAGVGREVHRAVAVDYLQTRPFMPLARLVGRPARPGDATAVAARVRDAIGGAVLLLEDAQWCDPDTIEAFPALAATGPLVVTVRPGGDAARRAIKQLETIGEVVDLGPLSVAASEELARRLLPDAPSRVAEITVASGGNPLALEALAHAGTSDSPDRATTLRAVVDTCAHGARVTLARLALHDPEVTSDTAGLPELVERRLVEIRPDGTVLPAAALLAELALTSLDPDERATLHRRRAESADDVAEAAMHWAAAGERSAAFAAAREAAGRATTDASRAQLLTVAADNASPDQVWRATREAVIAWLDLGDVDATHELVGRLDAHDPPTASDAVDRELMQMRFAIDDGRWHDALGTADDTIERYGDAMHVEQRMALLAGRAAAKGDLLDVRGALADANEAVRLGDQHGLSSAKAGLILAVINLVIGDDRWRRDLPAVFRRAVRDRDYGTAFEAGRLDALARFFDGDVDGGVAACRELHRLAERIDNRSWERGARALRASNLSLATLLDRGVVQELRQIVDDPALGTHRHATAILLAIAESDLGQIARADELIASTASTGRADGHLWARQEVAWNAGRFDEGVAVAQELLARAEPLDFGTPAAAVALRWIEWERYGTCTTRSGPLVVYRVQQGLLDEALGLELLCTPGREHDAARAFLRAAKLHDRYLRRNAVRCRWAAGEALLAAGAVEEAISMLEATRRTCEVHGMLPLLGRVQASLRKAGAASSTPARPTRDRTSLTPREREVLDLVRDGLSTVEIAARLHVRPSTVESHIRKSVKRLGASNRREAALLAQRAH